MNEPDDLLTTAEVALIVRAPVSTVRYWRYLDAGPKCFKLGRRVVYWRADVSAWLAEREATDRSRAAS
jgi:predicted DNA-binding transcriptional regulator AlpA